MPALMLSSMLASCSSVDAQRVRAALYSVTSPALASGVGAAATAAAKPASRTSVTPKLVRAKSDRAAEAVLGWPVPRSSRRTAWQACTQQATQKMQNQKWMTVKWVPKVLRAIRSLGTGPAIGFSHIHT